MSDTNATMLKLAGLQKQAEKISEEAVAARKLLQEKSQELRDVVNMYSDIRWNIVRNAMESAGFTFCSQCHSPAQKQETVLLLIEERYTKIASRVHRACAPCQEKSSRQHGPADDYRAPDKHWFYAFIVEVRDDGVYVNKFDKWEKLDMAEHPIPDFPHVALEHVATAQMTEWGFPPRIWVRTDDTLFVDNQPDGVAAP